MSKSFWLYIDFKQEFDEEKVLAALCALPGISEVRQGDPQALDVISFTYSGHGTLTDGGLSVDRTTITVSGTWDVSIACVVALVSGLGQSVRLTDSIASCDVVVRPGMSFEDLKHQLLEQWQRGGKTPTAVPPPEWQG